MTSQHVRNAILGVLLTLAGCGTGSSSGVDAGGSDARTFDDASTHPLPAACSFVLVSGTDRVTFTGSARARMNGSGNLVVLCEPSTGDAQAELDIGNATFDGPRVYTMDDFRSDGRIDYTAPASGPLYTSDTSGGGCVVDLTVAGPLDARGDSVIVGGQVQGTFTCSGLVGGAGDTPPSYTLEDGSFAATLE